MKTNSIIGIICIALSIIILILVHSHKDNSFSKPYQIKPQRIEKNIDSKIAPIKKNYIEVVAKITAYTPGKESCGKHANGRTSINQNAWVMDGVAVDPKAIPYGTKIWIDGIGLKEADDTGSAMRSAWRNNRMVHIDVRMPTVWAAKQWGVRYKHIKVYL